MKKPLSEKIIFLLYLLFFLFGLGLFGVPKEIDVQQNWISVLGAFFLFFSFLLSIYSYGALLNTFIFVDKRLNFFILGTIVFITISYVVLFLQWTGFSHFTYYILLFSLAPSVLLLSNNYIVIPGKILLSKVDLFIFFFCLFTLFLFFLLTFTLSSMPDPLWYHLTSARLFNEHGGFYLPLNNPIIFNAGSFEQLLTFGNILLGDKNYLGLIHGQFFGQWLHFFFFTLAAYGWWIFVGFFSKNTSERLVYWFIPLMAKELVQTTYLAKNDWFAICFCIWSILSIRFGNYLFAGLLCGVAFSAKYTSLYFILFALPFLVPTLNRKYFIRIFAGAFLGSAPLMLRNYFFTGSPIFPVYEQIFQTNLLGPTWLKGIQYFSQFHDFATKKKQILDWFLNSPYLLLIPIAIFLKFYKKINFDKKIYLAAFLPTVIFFFTTGSFTEPRLLGAALLIPIFLSTMIFWRSFEKTEFKFKPIIFILVPFFCTTYPYEAIRKSLTQKDPAEEIRLHEGGDGSAWLRMYADKNKRVASASETRMYYLLPTGAIRIWDDPIIDRELSKETEAIKILEVFLRHEITYLLLTRTVWDTYYDGKRWDMIYLVSDRFPESLDFSSELSRVINVPRAYSALKEHLQKSKLKN
ncbi:MAG: hypothetical protein M9962_03600 [Oligoflexia bacterium]|nr:hypothetical protein [Oligoflexia bacterium]